MPQVMEASARESGRLQQRVEHFGSQPTSSEERNFGVQEQRQLEPDGGVVEAD